ncbi:MAG: hypothetical protein JST92_03820 [Deltaproteobacteria bacterium]|nr:hypothetical protein [Deltaproteobacteria bacterium]
MRTHFASLCRSQAAQALVLGFALVSFGARAADSQEPVITHTPITKAATAPIHITARITDESKIFPQVFHRYDGKPFELPIDLKKIKGTKDQYEATLPFQDGQLDYYLECYDEFGNGPARAGSLEQPFHVVVGEGKPVAAPAAKTESRAVAVPEKALPIPTVSEVEQAKVDNHPAAPPPPAQPAPAPQSSPAASASAERSQPAPSQALQTRLETPPAPLTAEQALWHSALLPGWGQWRTERKIRGAAFGAAAGAALIATIWMSARAAQANTDWENAAPIAQADAYGQAQSYARGRNWAIGLLAGVWAVNVIEAYAGFGSKDPQ